MADYLDSLFEEYHTKSQKVDDMVIQLKQSVKSTHKFPVGTFYELMEMKRELLQLKKKVIDELKH